MSKGLNRFVSMRTGAYTQLLLSSFFIFLFIYFNRFRLSRVLFKNKHISQLHSISLLQLFFFFFFFFFFCASPSAVFNHLSSCETCKSNFSCDSFSIIDSGKNDFEITVKEALHIKFEKPTINRQLFTQGSSFVLNKF